MPGVFEALTFIVLSAQAGALGAGLAAVATAFAPALLSVGLSVLSSLLFAPKQPKPEDVQTSIRNPTAPRQRHYGRVKTSGPWAFGESEQGNLHKVIALGTGQLDAIEEFYLDDTLVTLDGNGVVQEDPWAFDEKVTIKYRLGLPTETHYSELTSVFSEWTSAHVGHGVSSLYIKQKAVDAEHFGELFPKVAETLYRVVCRGSLIYNPSTGTTVWGDNAASIIRDYMSHSDGMRLPASLFTTTQATAGWLAAYNRAARSTPKVGGSEDAYRLWGSYQFSERPADVLGRMMQSCDARIVPTPDGGVTLDIGDWEEPAVVIDEDMITGFSDVSRGRDILTTANVISATFLSPDHDYQATDADRWIDEDDVSLRGEIVQDTSFTMSPSHSQARRLMKLAAYRANPSWIGTFQCNIQALAAFGKRFVRITYPLFGIDEVFEVHDFRFNIGEGGILAGVTLQVASMPSAAYAWDADTEEGTAPISEGVTVDRTVPVPTGFTFTSDSNVTAGIPYVVGILSFDAAPTGLRVQGRYKKTADVQWIDVPVSEAAISAQTGVLDDGVEYEAQVRHVTTTGRPSDWSASETLTAVSDTVAPGLNTSISIAGGLGRATVAYTTPVAANLNDVVTYRVIAGGTPTDGDIVAALTQDVPPYTATPKSLTDGDATRTDLLTAPNDFTNAAWTKVNITVTAAAVVTLGHSFSKIEATATAATLILQDVVGAGVAAGNRVGFFAKKGSGATHFNTFILRNDTTATILQQFTVNWDTGVVTHSVGTGATMRDLGSGVWFITVGATSGISAGNTVRIYLGAGGASITAGNHFFLSDAAMIAITATCAPAGAWDYHLKARNHSGFGTLQGPHTVAVV